MHMFPHGPAAGHMGDTTWGRLNKDFAPKVPLKG